MTAKEKIPKEKKLNPVKIFCYACLEMFVNLKVVLSQSVIRSRPLVYGLNQTERPTKIILSLTSYPARFPTLDLTVRSLLNQTVRPDKIVLFLHKDSEYDKVTPNIKALEAYGLEIVPCDEDLRPHKKYFYAMQRYPDDIVITVDDDQYYSKRLVQYLYASYQRLPSAVSAARVKKIRFDENERPLPYRKWRRVGNKRLTPHNELLALGVGGVLYPPRCMDEQLFDAEKIKAICFAADDIWLKVMQIKKGTKVVTVPQANRLHLSPIATQKAALHKENLGNQRNDIYIQNVFREYSLTAAHFKENPPDEATGNA